MTPRIPVRSLATAGALTALLGLALWTAPAADPAARPASPGERLTSRPRSVAPAEKAAAVGEEVRTGATKRRRLLLADESVVLDGMVEFALSPPCAPC